MFCHKYCWSNFLDLDVFFGALSFAASYYFEKTWIFLQSSSLMFLIDCEFALEIFVIPSIFVQRTFSAEIFFFTPMYIFARDPNETYWTGCRQVRKRTPPPSRPFVIGARVSFVRVHLNDGICRPLMGNHEEKLATIILPEEYCENVRADDCLCPPPRHCRRRCRLITPCLELSAPRGEWLTSSV